MADADKSMIHISSTHQFDVLLRRNHRVVANFTSTYCKPCGFITPKYASLAAQHAKVITFAVVDVDANGPLAERYGVKGMPAFLMFRRARKVDECLGLDEDTLEAKVGKLAA